MPKRSFVPESPGPLEGRMLLSGSGRTPRLPVPLSGVAFNSGTDRIRADFEQYATGGNFQLLRSQLAQLSTAIPFAKRDGLGAKTNQVLDRMRQDQAAGVPGAVMTAFHQVMAGNKADVDARIADGTVRIFDKQA